jgi:hypothetical protein
MRARRSAAKFLAQSLIGPALESLRDDLRDLPGSVAQYSFLVGIGKMVRERSLVEVKPQTLLLGLAL